MSRRNLSVFQNSSATKKLAIGKKVSWQSKKAKRSGTEVIRTKTLTGEDINVEKQIKEDAAVKSKEYIERIDDGHQQTEKKSNDHFKNPKVYSEPSQISKVEVKLLQGLNEHSTIREWTFINERSGQFG